MLGKGMGLALNPVNYLALHTLATVPIEKKATVMKNILAASS